MLDRLHIAECLTWRRSATVLCDTDQMSGWSRQCCAQPDCRETESRNGRICTNDLSLLKSDLDRASRCGAKGQCTKRYFSASCETIIHISDIAILMRDSSSEAFLLKQIPLCFFSRPAPTDKVWCCLKILNFHCSFRQQPGGKSAAQLQGYPCWQPHNYSARRIDSSKVAAKLPSDIAESHNAERYPAIYVTLLIARWLGSSGIATSIHLITYDWVI